MSETDASAAGGEALSVDEAANLLAGTDAGVEPDEQSDDDEDDGPESGGDDDLDEGDGAPGEIKPPHSWDAEAKARFKELPADVQELISEREGERDRAVGRAMQEAAEARKRAEVEAGEALQMTQALDEIVPQAAQVFASKWDGIDWQGWAASDPEACLRARTEFEAEQAHLQHIGAVQQQAEAVQHARYVAREEQRLKVTAPDLADPKAGPARRQALASFLLGLGATEHQLAGMSAEEAGLAYDALRWRQAQAGLSSRGEPRVTRTVRPTAAPAEASSRRQANAALSKLARTGSVDDAVAYLRQRGR